MHKPVGAFNSYEEYASDETNPEIEEGEKWKRENINIGIT